MTMESNNARENISVLLEGGQNFESIAKYINSRKSLVKAFYEGSGKDLDAKQCDKLASFAMEQL